VRRAACLITKTDTNPFFVKMREGAEAKAEELGIELKAFAGRSTATMKPRSPPSRPASPMARGHPADGVRHLRHRPACSRRAMPGCW
jgi:hypothetical protein